jgi:hypothetical protein
MSRKIRSAIDQIEFMRNLLAFLLVGAFISVLPVLTFIAIPDSNKDVITYMVGQLSGMATTVLGFYFISKVGQDALDTTRSENTGKLADVAKAALDQTKTPSEVVDEAVEETAKAAVDMADQIKGEER